MAGKIDYVELRVFAPGDGGPYIILVGSAALAQTVLDLIVGEGAGHGQKVTGTITPVSGDPDTLVDGWRLQDTIAWTEDEGATVAWRAVGDYEADLWAEG